MFGVVAAVIVIAGAWLSPLAAGDRPALALLAVTLSVPLGAVAGRASTGLRDAGGIAAGAIVAALVFASVLTVFQPALWLRTGSWCVAGVLIGACLQSTVRGGGLFASSMWLFLCGLPFFYDKLPWYTETFRHWALEGSPWIGFSYDAIGGDPLRRSIIYMGHWTELGDAPVAGALTAGTLWLTALFTLAGLLATSLLRPTRQAT